jgi:tetratricopeptide (TPR) repeat protein/tRNA A-37 threonylcarbamoyl transferase component Bud32
VAAFDAERMRAAVAGRLFGAEAEPVKIGRYTVLKRLGAGGMGIVYSAYDDALDRKVAVKLLRGAETDALRRARLVREAQALARVSHPNVIHVYEVGEFRGQVFVAMEFVRGSTLESVALPPDGEHSLEQVLDAFAQAGRGLAAAHAAGLVHRDFKPENALIDDEGRVRVLDFGLARAADDEDHGESVSRSTGLDDEDVERVSSISGPSSASIDAPLTQTGAIMGTPAYMAPEQHLGRRTDARTDQFSFCVSLWEKLYGERPFAGKTIGQLAVNVTNGRVEEPKSYRGVPKFVHRAMLRGLSLDPQARFGTMQALIDALSIERRRRRRLILVGVGVAMAAAAAAAWLGSRSGPDPCAEVEEKLVGVWDDATKAKLSGVFSDSDVEYSQAAWDATRTRVDEYAGAWVTMHRAACQAAMVDRTESSEQYGRRLVCLGQRLTEVETLAHSLAEGDDAMIDHAVVAASNLGSLERCADQSALAKISEGVDDETRARLAALDRDLARGLTRLELGKYEEARVVGDESAVVAADLDDAGREARASLLGGRARSKLGRPEEAEEHLLRALRRADVARDDEARVLAGVWLIRVVGYQQRDFERAEKIARDAEAALEHLGSAPLLRAALDQQLGSAARIKGEHDKAVEYLQRSLSIRVAELGERDPTVAKTHNNLGTAFSDSHRYVEAERELRQAKLGFEEMLGDGHPHLSFTLSNLAAVLLERGREAGEPGKFAEEAERHARRALEIRIRVFGPDHGSIASHHNNLGQALRHQGRFAEAREHFARSLALQSNSSPEARAKRLTGLGAAEAGAGEREIALGHLEEAATLLDASSPSEAAETRFELARVLAAPGSGEDRERARALAARAMDDYAKAGTSYEADRTHIGRWLQQLD